MPKERDPLLLNGHHHQHHLQPSGAKGLSSPLVAALAAVYLIFAVALAHTAYIAFQGRSTASAGLHASTQSASAFTELKAELAELRKQLAESQAASRNASTLQLQQLKAHVTEQLRQPLNTTTAATQALLSHSQQVDKRFQELQKQVSVLNSRVQEPPPAPPAGARVEDAELHHIATHDNVCDKRGAAGLTVNVTEGLVAPLVVVGHNRPGYLAKTMMILLKYWTADPSYAQKFPLYISVDGDDQRTLLLASALHQAAGVQIITRRRSSGPQCPKADCHISQHYKLLLQLFLQCHKAPGLMFLEEDLEVAPDFFSYFEATAPLMARDSTILCVSAWNDHGQRGRVKDNRALYRTDVMPGLGWYINSAIGLELAPKWPFTNWDDWMRLASIRNGRSCIFPEVARTHTFGRVGTHGEEGFDNHLSKMQLNTQPVAWRNESLDYLLQSNYGPMYTAWMDAAEVWNGTITDLQSYCNVTQPDDDSQPGDLVYRYPAGKKGYEDTAKYLKPMMGDVREGSPRGSYQGHVVVRCRGRRLFLRAS